MGGIYKSYLDQGKTGTQTEPAAGSMPSAIPGGPLVAAPPDPSNHVAMKVWLDTMRQTYARNPEDSAVIGQLFSQMAKVLESQEAGPKLLSGKEKFRKATNKVLIGSIARYKDGISYDLFP